MLLVYLSLAWIIGILIGSKLSVPASFLFISITPLLLIPFLNRQKRTFILISLCLLLLFSGVLRFQSSIPHFDENHLAFYNDIGIVKIKGIVNSDPEITENTVHLHISAEEINIDGKWVEVTGNAILFVPMYSSYKYGDSIQFSGKLNTPPYLDDFDYKAYLSRQGIHSTMLYPDIMVLETGKGSKPLQWIYSLRNHLSYTFAEILPEPQASLAQGIILGKRGTIPQHVKDSFAITGTAHLLAISGLHLGIIAGIMLSIGLWLFGRRHYIYVYLALILLWLYTLLTGMNPPVVRGAIMASLFLVAELLGRQRSGIVSLVFAAAIMIGITPEIMWMASFQMSFMAMTGLITVSPIFMKWGEKWVDNISDTPNSLVRIVITSLSVTLGAIIAVWPIVAYHFGIISFIAPLATLLVLPVLPLIIITGIFAGFLGFIFVPLAKIIGWLTWLLLSYMLTIINGLALIPISSIEVEHFHPIFILAYYLVLAAAIWLYIRRKKLMFFSTQITAPKLQFSKKWIILPLLLLAVLVSLAAFTMPDDNLHVSFLDVGEGDAILIQTPAHQDILVDGGPSPQAIMPELGKQMPFWDRTIDMIILTHAHSDHLTGLFEVLRRYEVKRVMIPEIDNDSPLYAEWLNLLRTKDIDYSTAQAGQIIKLDEITSIKILNPQTSLLNDTESDIDNNGIVLKLCSGDVSFLLTADIMKGAELELIHSRVDLKSTVLKVAHHGSDTSTCSGFLSVVNPRIAVISAGADNRFNHPDTKVIERLERLINPYYIFRTDHHGTIEFITDGEMLWVEIER